MTISMQRILDESFPRINQFPFLKILRKIKVAVLKLANEQLSINFLGRFEHSKH